ncbi:helix-hairpin-helix domain-containing protein [Massilia sp. 2TAF26]|uniref:helix-hairpin-helix domain-containing protein n=1 Tax=Massilia sp. 2TAF26 TaxID=3233012 RepID=UPI003F95CDB7
MEAINGTVTRIVHASPTGGSIFRVMLEDTARTVRVVASSKAIQVKPREGECWGIFGDYENDRKYGHQFHAVSAVQKVPAGPLMIGLFGRHQLFAEFGASVGRRLWRTLGTEVYEALNQANHSLLAQAARIAPSAAVRLVKVWRSLCMQIEVATYFATHGLPVAVAVQAIDFWGASTIQVISANPYLLASLMSWRELDGIARTSFAIAETSPLRLIAACTTVANIYFSKHANWTMPLRDLQVGVKNKLGDNSLVALATELSVAAGAIFLSEASNKTVVQSRGWHILTTALTSRLSELASYGPKPNQELYRSALPFPKSLQDVGHAARDHPKGSVNLVYLSRQDLPSLMDEARLAGAIHLFLSTSQRDAVGIFGGSGKSQLIQQFLTNDLTRMPERDCYVIHGAEEIDVVVACKLLHVQSRLIVNAFDE